MKNLVTSFILLSVFVFFMACGSLEKEVDINLPEYEPELVVECYLEPGESVRLLLMESVSYFELPDIPLINDALVTIKHGDQIDTLANSLIGDPLAGKFFNYVSPNKIEADYETPFELFIEDSNGRQASAITMMPPKVPIDSIKYVFDDEGEEAYILVKFNDNPDEKNFYRRMLHVNTLDSLEIEFSFDDDFASDNVITLGSGYEYVSGDTIITTLVHITEDYYDYLESTFDAIGSNGNPFGQPASVKSNIENGIGIFTAFDQERNVLIIP